jgi:hypothetical protein
MKLKMKKTNILKISKKKVTLIKVTTLPKVKEMEDNLIKSLFNKINNKISNKIKKVSKIPKPFLKKTTYVKASKKKAKLASKKVLLNNLKFLKISKVKSRKKSTPN